MSAEGFKEQGDAYSDQKDWEKVTQLAQGRFFHRLLPAGDRKFAMVGGASMSGHINRVDFFEIDQ